MRTNRVLVTGATGTMGGEVVHLLAAKGIEVKAATRRPQLARTRFPGDVEVVELDYDRADTYDAALEWAEALLLVPPPFDPHAYELMSSFLDWAVQARCRHVVSLSAMAVEERDDLALRKLERHVEASGTGYTLLRPNIYMQNLLRGFVRTAIREEGILRLPAADARVSFVDARDVAAVAAEVLTDPSHLGRAYTLTGPEALDLTQVAGILSEVVDRTVSYEAEDDVAFAARLQERGWGPDTTAVVVRLSHTVRAGGRARVTGDVEAVLGRPPLAMSDFAREHAAGWR